MTQTTIYLLVSEMLDNFNREVAIAEEHELPPAEFIIRIQMAAVRALSGAAIELDQRTVALADQIDSMDERIKQLEDSASVELPSSS